MRIASRWNLVLLLALLAVAGVAAGCMGQGAGQYDAAKFAEWNTGNLLPNPGFNEGFDEEEGAPVGWLRQGATVGQITNELIYVGEYSFKGVDKPGSSIGIRTPRYEVKPGEYYELKVFVRTEGGRVWAGIETWESLDSTSRVQLVQQHTEADGAWQELTVPLTIPDGINAISVILYTLQVNEGVAYWNAPRLIKYED